MITNDVGFMIDAGASTSAVQYAEAGRVGV
jgi:predicted aspartyl protease